MVRICFVCLGNICRSPTAEGIFRHLARASGLDSEMRIESAGTGDWHVGEPPDRRTLAAAKKRGIALESRAQQFTAATFSRFDYAIAMDKEIRRTLIELARSDEERAKIHLLRDFDGGSVKDSDVPDPYYGGEAGFHHVFEVCLAGCEGLLAHLRSEHGW